MIVSRLHSHWSKILITWTFTNLVVPRLAEILIPIANSMIPFGHHQRHEFITCGRNSRYVNEDRKRTRCRCLFLLNQTDAMTFKRVEKGKRFDLEESLLPGTERRHCELCFQGKNS